MIRSMTAFASQQGHNDDLEWTWEMRAVNGRGLDVKLRLPDGFAMLEEPARKTVQAAVSRGSVLVTLKVKRAEGTQAGVLDPDRLDHALAMLGHIQSRAAEQGVDAVPPSACEILTLKGVVTYGETAAISDDQMRDVRDSIAPLIDAFLDMREAEGRALLTLLSDQITQISDLVDQAETVAKDRPAKQREFMERALDKIDITGTGVDAERLSQELALLLVKGDVTEELDRLRAHVSAARALLDSSDPIGRKLDFLAQEFNRESNTLCSKSQDTALTTIGLSLKTVIDQMREQVQNVE